MNDNEFSIWVGSYGAYNEGYLVGKWFTLPMASDELWDGIKDACMVERFGDEVGVFDYDDNTGIGLGKLGECADIDELNALAAALEKTEYDPDAIKAWFDNDPYEMTAMKLANVVMDCDNIPFYYYPTGDGFNSKEYRFGRMLIEEGDCDLYKALVDRSLEDYFDYESYGKNESIGVALYDEGYLDPDANTPDTDYYKTAQELLEELGYWDDEED